MWRDKIVSIERDSGKILAHQNRRSVRIQASILLMMCAIKFDDDPATRCGELKINNTDIIKTILLLMLLWQFLILFIKLIRQIYLSWLNDKNIKSIHDLPGEWPSRAITESNIFWLAVVQHPTNRKDSKRHRAQIITYYFLQTSFIIDDGHVWAHVNNQWLLLKKYKSHSLFSNYYGIRQKS